MKGKDLVESNPNIDPFSSKVSNSRMSTNIPKESNADPNNTFGDTVSGSAKYPYLVSPGMGTNSQTVDNFSIKTNTTTTSSSSYSRHTITSPVSPLAQQADLNSTQSGASKNVGNLYSNINNNTATNFHTASFSNSGYNIALDPNSSPISTTKSSTTDSLKSPQSSQSYQNFTKFTDIEIADTKNIPLKFLPIENAIITAMFKKIDLLLPYKTGFTVSQVLADPFYIQTKQHLLRLSENISYLHDLIASIYNLLLQILEKDNSSSLFDKNVNVLNSIYIMVVLLSNFLNALKAKESLNHPSGAIFKAAGMKATPFLVYKTHLPSEPLTSLDPNLASNLLSLLTSLKNDTNCIVALNDITDNSLESDSSVKLNASLSSTVGLSSLPNMKRALSVSDNTSANPSTTSSSNNTMTENDLHSNSTCCDDHLEAKELLLKKHKLANFEIISLIDDNISSSMIYLAASNSDSYFEYVKSIFKKFNNNNLFIRGSHILKFAFLTSSNFNDYCLFLREVIYVTKRQSQQVLILYFFYESLLSWALNRSADFLKAVDTPSLAKHAEVLFDILLKHLDVKYCPKVYYSILSSLCFFQPKQLSKFIADKLKKSTTQVLKRSISSVAKMNSSKQKFLTDFTQLALKTPAYAQPLISFLLVGCAISVYDNDHPIFLMVTLLKSSLIKQLELDNFETFTSPVPTANHITEANPFNHQQERNSHAIMVNSNSKVMKELKVGLFAIQAVVNPAKLPERIFRILNDSKHALDLLYLVTGGFRLLIGIPSLTDLVFNFIQGLTPTLIKVLAILSDSLFLLSSKKLVGGSLGNVERFDYGLLDSAKYHTFSHDPFTLSEPIHFSLLEKQIKKADESLLEENIVNLLLIYSSYSFLCYNVIENNDYHKFGETFKLFIDKISNLLSIDDEKINTATQSLLLSFCSTVSSSDPTMVFSSYIATSILIDSVSSVAIFPNTSSENRNQLIKLILSLLEERSENSDLLLKYENRDQINSVHTSGACQKIIKNFEQLVFLGLCSDNVETIRTSKRLLQFYVFVLTNTHHFATCFDTSNLGLARDILTDKMSFGTVSIRKRLRDRFCRLKEPTELLINLWSLMYEKVSIAYDYANSPAVTAPIDVIDDFLSKHVLIDEVEVYGEYVASLGGIIMAPLFKDDPRQPHLQKKLERFIGNKVLSLFSVDLKKREHSREILSVSIHPYNCDFLSRFAKYVLPRFELALRNHQYNVCELFLSLLRAICKVETESLFSIATVLWDINYSLLKVLNIDSNEPDFLRLKLKFCKLQVLFLEKLDALSLNGNILKKNEYARFAADYLESSFQFGSEPQPQSNKVLNFMTSTTNKSSKTKNFSNKLKEFKENELKDLHIDIKVEVSHMLKLIFYKLPLDTPRHNGNSEEEKSAASVIFSNYFNLFVRLLEKLNGLKDDEESHMAILHRSTNIISGIIQALINLLNANPDIGLKYSLPLGYHPDELIRISFIDVFSTIIKDLYSSYERKVSISLLQNQYYDIMTNDVSLFLASASCCPKSELEQFATSILQLRINKRVKMRLLLALIRYDVLHTTDKNEILRSNTVGTRITALFSYDNAKDYLISIFRPIFTEMIEFKEFFEIEKINGQSEEETKQNIKLFFKYLNKISVAIFNSIDRMPIGIRLIAKTIYDATTQVLPEIKFTAVNAYLFLRLYNPTIVTPQRAGIVNNQDLLFKRSLIQIARVIQTVVNEAPLRLPALESKVDELGFTKNIFFKFMEDVVDFDVDKGFEKIADVVDYSNGNCLLSDDENYLCKDDDKSANCDLFLHGYFYDNWMAIRENYLLHPCFNNESMNVKMQNVVKFDKVLADMGLPKRVKGFQIPESVKSDKSPRGILLYDFMSTASLSVPNSFIKVLITKDGLPLICINTLDFPEDITHELYAFQILQTLTKFWESSYCLLIDLTAFGDYDLIANGRALMNSMIAPKYKVNCRRIYHVNMSPQYFMKFKNIIIPYIDEEKMVNPEFIFITTNDDTNTMAKNKLIGYSNLVSNDNRVTFTDVSLYQEESKRFIPVKLKIGNHFIQITSALPQRIKILNKMYVVNLVDCFKLEKLIDIGLTSFTGVSNELSMADKQNDKRIILTSTKKIEIMRTLYFSKARLNNNNYNEDELSIASSPKFSVGQLLNTAFLGLLSKSGEIRSSSYQLLSSIQNSVGLKTGKYVDSIEGVVFPYGDIDYVTSISSSIAQNHPNLTYAYIYGLFAAYDKISDEDKNSMILCASPWVKNIYTSVFLSDSLRGPSRTSNLIRKFVRASREQRDFQVFSLFIWPQLSLEDGLIEIIIDEIVAASIDHEAEGHDWQGITKYWPLRSSIEICNVIIKRMKEKSYNMPIDETEIVSHTRWIETTVLARFLSYLMFDSLLFVDRYISDIFYIVTIYMDHGPLELRRCLLHLLTRTFHSYLSKPYLTIEQDKLIKNQLELLNGARFRMLFGLTREDDDNSNFKHYTMLGTDIISRASAVTTLCDLLTSFLHNFLEPEEYELQMVKWNINVSRIAFDYNAQLQSRAILIIGSLTKQGISSRFVFKLIDLLKKNGALYVQSTSTDLSRPLKLIMCSFHAFGKAINGLGGDSIFHPTIFWFHLNLLLFDNISMYLYGTQYIGTTLNLIHEHTKERNLNLVDYLFKHKEPLSRQFEITEAEFDFKLTKENFDVVLSLLLCKGLESPFTYNSANESLKTLLSIRYEEHLRFPDDENNDFCCYLLFVFLTTNNNEDFTSILESCGLVDLEYIESANNTLIPKILLKWLSVTTLNVYSTCVGASNYFLRQKLDELASTRVISLYVESYRREPEIIIRLFSQVNGVLKKFVLSSNTSNLLEIVLDMIVTLMNKPEFKTLQFNEIECKQKLTDNNINGIENFTFTQKNPNTDAALVLPFDVRKRRLDMAVEILKRVEEVCNFMNEE